MQCNQDELDRTCVTEPAFNGYVQENVWKNDVRQRWAYDIYAFIGHELTLVPQVEHVFVSREDRETLRVTAVVNVRDSGVRSAIYKREQAIMDELKNYEFDFHVIAREGRPLNELITDAGAGDSAL